MFSLRMVELLTILYSPLHSLSTQAVALLARTWHFTPKTMAEFPATAGWRVQRAVCRTTAGGSTGTSQHVNSLSIIGNNVSLLFLTCATLYWNNLTLGKSFWKNIFLLFIEINKSTNSVCFAMCISNCKVTICLVMQVE